MDNEFRHFNIGFKAVAIVLVLAVFATLIPTRIFINVYAEDPGATLTDPDYAALSGFPETTESEYESGGITLPDKSDEYEQLALEKLGQPATVEKIDPYKRSDVSYQKTDLVNPFTRDYVLKNGNHTRLVFGSPVNYKNGEGVWKKIDLTLHEENGRLGTIDAPYTLSFAASSEDGDGLIDLDYNGAYISLVPLNTSAEPSEARYAAVLHTDDELLTENPCNNGTVVYHDLFFSSDTSPSASLKYTIKPYEIKEDIVISEGGFEQYIYSFILSVNNCNVELKDSCILIFDESGNAVFKLTAEYMKDAKGECSDRVAMTLDETEDGFLIAVSADAEWINEEGREFPVRIDPTISISNPDTDAYDAVWVSGNTRDYGLAVGTNTLTYVLFANDILSGLPTGATVSHTSATFDVNNQSATTFAGTCAVRAELISGNWSTAAVKQGGSLPSIQPSYAGLTDSCINSYSLASHGHFSFTLDLTEVLRKSFYRTDNGFMLGTECLSGSFPSKTVLALEALQITYSDHSGLNSYQSDHMISIDGSGTAYIKDINGKVSYIHPGISTKGAIVPVSVDMVFDLSFIGTATDAYYGKGWRPSIVQTMKSETITDINDVSKTFYVLTDGTGGKHYFAEPNGTLYIAEENPFQTYNANLKTLSYGDGSIATFNAAGYMVEYRNSYGDYYTIAYDGSTGKINSVTDGSGVTIVFEYSQSGKLVGIEIENCCDRGISLLHTGDSLTRIGTASGENTGFAYLTNGEMYSFGYRKTLNETQDRVYVSFSYFPAWSNGDLSVAYVERFELQDNFTYSLCECVGLSFSANTIYSHYYGAINTPFYTEYIYFDRNGRTVAVFDSLGNASGSEYAGGNISKMNLISGKTNSVMTDGNLIKDFSKKTSAWTTYTVAGSGNLYAEDDSSHFRSSKYGGEYFKLTSNSSTSEVFAKYSVSSAEPGKTYTLAVDIDPLSLIGTGGIVIGAIYSFCGTTLKNLSPVKYYEIDQRIQYSFEIPSAALPGSISVLIGVKNLSGDLFFDLVSLTEGACDRPVNMISDSGFYYGTSAWNVENSFSPAVVTSDRIRSIEIPGSIGETRRVSQVLSSTVSDGNYLIVSGFGKGKAVSSGKFGIIVDFDDSSLTDRELLFSNNTAEWQYVTAIIAIPDTNGGSTVTIRLVNDYNYTDVCFGGVTVEYVNGIGEYINRSLYTYNETNGLPLTEKAFSGEMTVYSYDQTIPNRVSSTVHTDVRKNVTTTEYSYNASSYEVVSTAESFKPNGSVQPTVQTTTNYVYNSNGNLTESVTFLANTSPASEVAHRLIDYSTNGRFLEKEADASGRFLLYSYSFAGDLLSVTDGDGNVTAYTYDSYGRLTGESCDGSSFGITYGSDSTEITRTSFSYSIDQNAAGNSTAFTILDSTGDPYRTLATYTYGGTFGQISKLTFGNGQEKYYGYDSLGNLKYIGFSPSDTEISAAYVWYYDLNGNVVSTLDRSDPTNLVTKWYSYDQEGNLDQILSSDGNTIYYRHSTTFDQRYESFTTAGTGRKYDSTISRSESERNLTADSSLGKRTVVYDDLGRITSFSYEALYSTITKSYSFTNKNSTVTNDNQTYTLKNDTSLVSSETCSVSGVPTISYTYYDNGKIETILENGAQIKKYEYDALGQLVREDNKQLNGGNGYTIKYVYDNCGNILGKMIFSYSPNVSTNDLFFQATLVSFPIYGYDATFNDLLATYTGASLFSYDNAGNPLTYYGGKSYTMTWTGGNKLSTVTPQGNTYAQSYFYDADGLRTVKTLVSNANVSKKINYFWVGNTLRSEWADDGSYEIVYVYDAAGRICGFSYSQNGGNEALYRYVRNAQGDVTHLVDINGAIVAAYTYDTWGKLISIKNGDGTDITNDASSIGYINPIRYRGYYYDNETGFYYLQSRYYDPVIGRFLNADSQLNLQDGSLGTNLYCYCGNDPVSGYDPEGTWDWGTFVNGLIMVGTAAICIASVAASVASCGTLTPLMTAVACVTVAAAVAYAFEGVSEMVEAGTGYNYIREKIFNGNEEAYEASKVVLSSLMQIGTSIIGSGTCFIAGTLVATENGLVDIETIKAGDQVWAYDENNGDVGLKEVVQTFVKEADELVHVTVKGKEIVCTNEHPFYSPIKGWTAACKLRAGDILVTVNGEYVVVEKIQHEILESPVRVYNFEVEGYHTYYVGEEGVLVHNDCHQSYSWRKQKADYWKAHQDTASPLYELSDENISLMSKGKAPIGYDGYRIELHHIFGINNSDIIVPITKESHTILHKFIGYSNFLEYFLRM